MILLLFIYFPLQAFGDAYRLVEPSAKIHEVLAPYIIENQTGLELLLKLDNIFQVSWKQFA